MAYVPLTISIPEPCSVPWSGMTPVSEMERHCASCDKVITDFSMMSDAQIGRTLVANGGRLCGRFRRDQLDRPLRLNGPRHRRGLGPVAAAASMLLAVPAFGQGATPPPTEQTEPSPKTNQPAGTHLLRGVIHDLENGMEMIGATVVLKGTNSGTVTDLDGRFELKVPAGLPVTLIISYIGYTSKEVVLSAEEVADMTKGEDAAPIKITLDPMAGDLLAGGIVCISYNPKPSLLENLLNHKIQTFTPERPLGPAKGDWKAYWRELFAERKSRRQQRKAERIARKATRVEDAPVVITDQETEMYMPETKAAGPVGTYSLSASPNPFRHELTVSFTLPADQRIHLELFDGSGRQLFRWQEKGFTGKQTITLKRDFSGMMPGLYVLRLVDEEGQVESVQLLRQ